MSKKQNQTKAKLAQQTTEENQMTDKSTEETNAENQSQEASDKAIVTGDTTTAPEETKEETTTSNDTSASQEEQSKEDVVEAKAAELDPVVVADPVVLPIEEVQVPVVTQSVVEQPIVVTADIVTQVISDDPNQASIDNIKATGSVSGKATISALESYIEKMKPGVPVESKEGARHQEFLWRTLSNLIDSDTEDFQEVFRGVLALVHREGRAAFAETHLFRFTENIALGHAQTKAFLALLDLIKVTADPKGRFLALKQVDFHRSTEHYWSERARQRLTNFYNL